MGELTAAIITGIVFYAIYKIFELIIRRRERLMIIEKWTPDGSESFKMPNFADTAIPGKFLSLRAGCLLFGIGLGLVAGVLLSNNIQPSGLMNGYNIWTMAGIINAASMMLFGGLGMLISFIVEMKWLKNHKKDED